MAMANPSISKTGYGRDRIQRLLSSLTIGRNGLRFNDSLRIAKIKTIDNDLRNLGGNSQIQSADLIPGDESPRHQFDFDVRIEKGAVGSRVGAGRLRAPSSRIRQR